MADDTGPKVAVVASALLALGIVFAALADTPRLCAPGQQKSCTCEDPSASGLQSCAPDGAKWSVCERCPEVAPTGHAEAAAAAAAPAPPPAEPSCSAKIGALKVSNRKLTGETVASEVAKAEGALSTCCSTAASGKPPAHGAVRLTVGRDGKVANVASAGRGAAAALPACALEAFRELDFAPACKPEGAKCNASTSVEVPLTFETR
jgi:hypothetical protein